MASEGGAARRLAGRRGFVRRIHDERSVRYGVHLYRRFESEPPEEQAPIRKLRNGAG